ncbi:hypothetical protein GW17_00020293 [Ensete ventricosum]|nr:hypothetical protein GW17_00020293 [Ensete ventricosum]RZR99038.1 hypothetical protein BHM03_00028512 [Ensete ventricosum]
MRRNENGRDGAAATRRPNKKRGRQWQRRPNSSVYARGMTDGFGVEDGELTRIWEAGREERGKPRKSRKSVTHKVASPLRCRSEERASVCFQRTFVLLPGGHHTVPPTGEVVAARRLVKATLRGPLCSRCFERSRNPPHLPWDCGIGRGPWGQCTDAAGSLADVSVSDACKMTIWVPPVEDEIRISGRWRLDGPI